LVEEAHQVEYREPTDDEWREFQDHFEMREVELGTSMPPRPKSRRWSGSEHEARPARI
jgi:hypothetical protein